MLLAATRAALDTFSMLGDLKVTVNVRPLVADDAAARPVSQSPRAGPRNATGPFKN